MEKIRRYGRETNFTDIMYIKFTSDFETYLDKIADGIMFSRIEEMRR